MTWQESNDDALDDVLRKAAWPQPRAEQVARLEGDWRRMVRRRKIRTGASLAAAISVPVAVLALCWSIISQRKHDESLVAKQPPPAKSVVPNVNDDRGVAVVKDETNRTTSAHDDVESPTFVAEATGAAESNRLVRDPTAYEQAMVLVLNHSAMGQATVAKSAGTPNSTIRNAASEVNQNAVAANTDNMPAPLAGNGEAEKRKQAEIDKQQRVAEETKQKHIAELFAAMNNPRVAVRLAAANELGAMNDPNISKQLAGMAMDNVNRREAIVALLASDDPVARSFLTYARRSVELASSVQAISQRMAAGGG